ncbi:hypothetical protein Rhe02_65880 [Rhizocola hellebori]|uniref:Uncharacterized protein n=1 Tax=Rhizocola hellebori TaxID=1392758 RepID=A0A8J3QD77_9ACTN|nr:hypothetical protein [Rhizocola hellebori]GIH08521.1 hypothetical protein Rhe02_65880 [Rhizocola hellebori]
MSAAYATDELRLLARLSGTALPPSLDSTWHAGDEMVADVVAARVLLARGAVSLGGPNALRVTAAVDQIFSPLRQATTILEIECRVAGSGTRREIAAWCGEGGVHLVEREPDVWQLNACGSRPELADLLPAADVALDTAFTLPAFVFDRVRLHHQAGEPLVAADLLNGVAERAVFLSALDNQRTEVVIRAAHRIDDDTFALDELWWLDCGAAGLWRLITSPDGDNAPTVAVCAVRVEDLRTAIAELETPV